jgi:WhiB family redox-sensing transcriptional regulator
VIEQCRRHALAAEERYGVWGGLTETDRTAVIRARRAAARLPPSD